jgi:hypothetical protein
MSKPEIRQAYLIGVDAGKSALSTELDRVAQTTETRIVRELDRFRRELIERRSTARSRVVAHCIAIIKGEDFSEQD